ncbi:acetyl-CoA C-acyltransferase [Pararhodobacter oceanensis]|uniref:acetyl-CoA C-acyltransferase n=1 Tax=Pararhodobacter oceanensis TaxID=2172121 RepID=UPI003A92F9D6
MDAFIIDAIRTPRGRGKAGATLSELRAVDLLGGLFTEMAQRFDGLDSYADDTLIGCATQVGDQGANIGKAASLMAGWAHSAPAATLNRFCASGLSATAMMAERAAIHDVVTVAGGVEMMSRTPMLSDKGAMFMDPEIARKLGAMHPGVAADLVATQFGFSREDCDAYAALSQERAAAAQDAGRFRSIVPVRNAAGEVLLAQDETIRRGNTAEKMAALEPAFVKAGEGRDGDTVRALFPDLGPLTHVHHAGNSPAMADGAALVVLASEAAAKRHGLKPRARIISTAEANVAITQIGAVEATRKALARANMSADDMDLWEVRDSFAAVTLHYIQQMEAPMDKFNVNGSSIALGHPMGATGAVLVGSLLDELELRGLRRGVVAITGAAGVASAAVLELVD